MTGMVQNSVHSSVAVQCFSNWEPLHVSLTRSGMGPETAFLMHSQVTLMLPIQEPH
jgi:hypothetical protein